MATKKDTPPPVAVVGIGIRLPGGVSTPEDFWSLLVNKKDGRCRVPADRYNVNAFYDNNKLNHQMVASDHGYFLQDVNLKSFDAPFFSMNRSEVEILDPQQRLLLEVVWECMESGGQTNWRGSNIGCYVGVFGEDWHDLTASDTQASGLFRITGSGDFALSNRISYEYNLQGPSMTIRTACSSTLSSLHEACRALQNGECSGAIVAGSNLILSPSMTMAMTEQGVLSPTGSCKTFDEAADGYARGEAVNAVYIKLLDNAIRDKDPIRAIIRATAINCDGKTAGIACPSVESHEKLIRKTYEVAGISDVSLTPYVECHGTGTQIGDPLEATAVANVFGERGTYIGSAKPNVGHSEGASGITSLIKVVLALENGVIPPNINFSKPNPNIPFQSGKLQVPVEAMPWPVDRPARASVNSFGIGGANAHVIVDSTASFGMSRLVPTETNGNRSMNSHHEAANGSSNESCNGTSDKVTNRFCTEYTNGKPREHRNGIRKGLCGGIAKSWPFLLAISANSPVSLRTRVQDLQEYVKSRPESLDGVVHTLGTCRDHLPHRTFCIANGGNEPLDFENFQKAPVSAPNVTFIFTGQGSQWAGMGKDLIRRSPSFRDDIQGLDRILQKLAEPPQWTIEEILCSDNAGDLIGKAEFSQPACTAVQIALTNLLAKCGVTPTAIIGHSSGEIAGAYAAGALTTAEAILNSYFRGQAVKLQTRKGGMAAVGLGRHSVSDFLADGALVACENSPKSVTLSGDEDAIKQTVEDIKAKNLDTFVRRLNVDIAYHSPHMHDVGEIYEEMLKQHLTGKEAIVPFYSSVMGHRVTEETKFDPAYWKSNLESMVLFSTAVLTLLDELKQESIFLEVGPHSALQGPLRQIFQEHSSKAPVYIPTLIRGKNCATSILRSMGQLYAYGSAVDFSFINPPAPILTDIPRYPWDHTSEFWNESRISLGWRQKKHPYHELLGSKCLEASDTEPMWRNLLRVLDVPWLKDHKIVNDIVFPCAGYIAAMGEAIRQVTCSEVYTLRNLVIKSAMVLQESEIIEMVTTMKPSRLTDSTNSSWYEFSISSFNGTSWIQHCAAEGKPGQEHAPVKSPITPFPRRISEDFWYERMNHLGLNYGTRFRGLKEISAHTKKTAATARIREDKSEHEARYSVHPTTLDMCLQLFTVAMTSGVSRRLETLAVPATVGYVCVKPGGPNLVAEAVARVDAKGVIRGDVLAVADTDEVVINLENGKFTPLETGDPSDNMNPSAAARLEWRPDIDFLHPRDLMRRVFNKRDAKLLLERFCSLCIIRTLDTLASLDTPPGHLGKFVSWLQQEKEHMIEGGWALLVPEAQLWATLDTESRNCLWNFVGNELEAVDDHDTSMIGKIYRAISDVDNLRDIFVGKVNPVELMLKDGGLTSLYNFYGGMVNYDEFFFLSAHAQPTLKVLEIGAGTGATTESVLKALISREGTRMYSEYTFTDISSGFFTAAQQRFQEYAGLDYKMLDISKDPAEQGFDLHSYDLIVASNVLHATPSLHGALQNVRSLLRPGGRLFLHELVQPLAWRWISFLTGFLPGWWLGENDDRLNGPLVSVERWDKELRETGFSRADDIFLDDEFPYQISGTMVATAIEPNTLTKDVTFLYNKEKHKFACELAGRFEKEGIKVHWSRIIDQTHIPGQDVISTIDLEGPYFHDISAADYEIFMTYLSKLQAGMLWLTRPAQIRCIDPRYGLVIGLARTIRSELLQEFSTLELQTLDPATSDSVFAVFLKFHGRSPSSDYNVEPEFAVHGGVIHTGRYHWIPAINELESALNNNDPKRLTIGRYGLLDSLLWVQHESTTLQDDEVEMDIRCVGLNFRDILVAMGIVDGPRDTLGLEASGVITRVGLAVDHVKVGDRVIAMDDGCFASRKVVLGQLVVRIPNNLSHEDAATMPTVYTTVIHSIVNEGRLAKGQTILIQSACGGVGLAALQICKMLGAEIYATVGNEEKVQYLMNHYDLPRERIFNSRNVSFLQDVMLATGGRGVDMVLNSLSGELLHASWKCIAEYGKMLEIGKRDFIGRGQLALDPFEANRTFYGIDLARLQQDRPWEIRRLMEQCMQYYEQGHIKPIRPIKVYQAQEVADAFRYMQSGQHIGKIVVTMPEEAKHISATKVRRQTTLSDTSTYLLVGGLGGLGKPLATWMVEHGAKSFVFLSRSAGKSSEDQDFFRELRSQGCYAVAVAGSVVDPADVRKAVNAAPTPIAGVIQMSMVLRDLPVLDTGFGDWNVVQSPKVRGTWNLHEALSGAKLDFFILLSSLSAVWGQPGQANYASANTFLDSFVQYRQNLNLPCSVVNVGVMEGIGFVSRNPAALNQFRAAGTYVLQEQDFLDAIQISIGRSLPSRAPTGPYSSYSSLGQLTIGLRSSKPLSEPSNRTVWKRDIRMSLYRQLESTSELSIDCDDSGLRDLLNSAVVTPEVLHYPASLELVTREIGLTLCGFMLQPEENLDLTMPLGAMGVDSLVSIEVRNWWRRTLGVEISVLEIVNAGSIERLGKMAIASLQEKHGVKLESKFGGETYLLMKAP